MFSYILGFLLLVQSSDAEANKQMLSCAGVVARLQSSARLVTGSQVETKLQEVEGSNSNHRYKVDWRAQILPIRSWIEYNFLGGKSDVQIVLEPSQDKNSAHQIRVTLPRGVEDEYLDVSLLKAVLESIYERSVLGDRYEILIGDPTIIERLNEVLHEKLLKTGEIPFELRRPTGEPIDSQYEEGLSFNPQSDAFFPFTSRAEGEELLQKINQNADLSSALNVALSEIEFGKAIANSGEWIGRIELSANSRVKPRPADEERHSIYPTEWKITLESQW